MNSKPTENEIDNLVIAEADNDASWEDAVIVRRQRKHSINFPKAFDIVSDKHILSGTPVFRGTQVPVSALLDNLENGVSVDGFIKKFPTVKREQAVKILELFRSSLSQLKAL
jgi:uncharacterized protein (DUF433 family)